MKVYDRYRGQEADWTTEAMVTEAVFDLDPEGAQQIARLAGIVSRLVDRLPEAARLDVIAHWRFQPVTQD